MAKNITLQLKSTIYRDLERISRNQHVSFKFIIIDAIKDKIQEEKRKKNLSRTVKKLSGLIQDAPAAAQNYKKILYA